MNEFEYRITEEVYQWMISGIKNIEIRLLNEKSSKIKVDDVINFKVLDSEDKIVKVRVTGLFIHKNINSLFEDIDVKKIAPVEKKEIESMLYNIFGKEKVQSHYIVGIKFEVIR